MVSCFEDAVKRKERTSLFTFGLMDSNFVDFINYTLSEAAKYDKVKRKANLKKGRDCMKNKVIWRVVLVVGMIPFVFPFLNFAYEMFITSSWKLGEWLLLWSFVYWPTYIVGLILIILSVCKLRK